MAVRILTSSATYSTSAGSWSKCNQVNIPSSWNNTSSYDDANSTLNAASFTSTNGRVYKGVWLGLRRTGTLTGTFNVSLYESTTQQATSGNLTVNNTNLPHLSNFIYIPFTSPWTGDGNSVNIRLTASIAGNVYWWRDGTASNWMYAVVDNSDDASAPSSGDTIILKNGVTLTMDTSATFGPTSGASILISESSLLSIPNPASPITIALGAGGIYYSGSSGGIAIGTSGTPVANAGTTPGVTLTTSLASSSTLFQRPVFFSYNGDSLFTVDIYGQTSDGMYVTANGSAASGQKVIATNESIPASWTNGDTVVISGKDKTTNDSVTYTGTFSTKQVTVNTNLDTKVLSGAAIINQTEFSRLGIKISSTNPINWMAAGDPVPFQDYISYENIQGVWFVGIQSGMGCANVSVPSYSNLAYQGLASYTQPPMFGSNVAGMTLSNVIYTNPTTGFSAGFSIHGVSVTASNIAIQNAENADGANPSQQYGLVGTNISLSNFVINECSNSSGNAALGVWGYGHTLKNGTLIGNQIYSNASAATYINVNQQRSPAYGLSIDNQAAVSHSGCTYGVGSTNATADIKHISTTTSQVYMSGCNIGSQGVSSNYQNTIAGSYLEIHNYNGTVGDDRTWKPAGTFTTDSSAYTDLVQTGQVASSLLEHDFSTLSQTISGNLYYLAVTGQISSSNYYGGTYTLPKVDVYADGIATGYPNTPTTPTATAQLSASTSSQEVTTSFTPSTNNNQVALAFRTKTDQAGSNAKVTWTAASLISRIIGYKFNTLSLGISETLTYPIGTLTTPVSDAFWAVTNPTTLAGYSSLFSMNFGTNTMTVTANATVQQMYDYYHYLLTQSGNITQTENFTTLDGQNYTANMNITINSSVTLSGSTSINIGSNTWTNNGSYTGIVIQTSDRLVHITLTGLVSGSTVYIQDTTNSVNIYNAVVSATSLDYIYTYTSNINLDIRVRYASGTTAYLPYEATGVVTNAGFTLNVSQSSDTIFNANAIDGSTVTEFSLSGGTIKIFVSASSNTTTGQRMYNWYAYSLATTTYIGLQPFDITAQTSWSYILNNSLLIYNQKSNVLFISGANINNVTGNGQVIDTSGGPININGYFPFNSASDVGNTVWTNSKALTVGKFIALK